MRARHATLPLGVDAGTARTRVALCRRDPDGAARIVAVATRPTNDEPAAALRAAWAELGTVERRCVVALSAPDAALRSVRFPPMPRAERSRAALLEARRLVEIAPADAAVRIVEDDGARCTLAIARRSVLAARTALIRAAGLRCVGADDAAFALLRALPDADVVVDVGSRRSVVVAAADPLPEVTVVALGGAALTAAIVAALGIDASAAERRKATVGLAGAGDYARAALVEQLAVALATVRSAARREPRSVVLTGNGARLHGLAEALEGAIAIPVRLAELAPERGDGIPGDVLRNAGPDWALAYGLALWELAG